MGDASKVNVTGFQFKHCTIIRKPSTTTPKWKRPISIQALYDYKQTWQKDSISISVISIQALYDYKILQPILQTRHYFISIQALYDYKDFDPKYDGWVSLFQFKHCTIISPGHTFRRYAILISIQALYDYKENKFNDPEYSSINFNSSIVRL